MLFWYIVALYKHNFNKQGHDFKKNARAAHLRQRKMGHLEEHNAIAATIVEFSLYMIRQHQERHCGMLLPSIMRRCQSWRSVFI